MNELDISNTQALIFVMVLIGLNHRDREKAPNWSEKTGNWEKDLVRV